jgi:acetoin utilization deacetylase AcuC-like enzyme
MKVFYSDNYVASGYAFDTTRKSQHVAERIAGLAEVTEPIGDFSDVIRSIHSSEYVDAVITGSPLELAESQGFSWDEGLPVMAQAHADGLLSAMTEVASGATTRSGSLSSGLHHARFENGEGFCTFNGLAAAAMPYIMAGKNVLVLDFDAHCGGGTWDILGNVANFSQIDVSVSSFDSYNVNDEISCLNVVHPSNYIEAIEDALVRMNKQTWDFIIYNAGMDPINLGVKADVLKKREWLVSAAIDSTPAIFALAGGYAWDGITPEEIVELHSYTVEAWA